MHYKTTYIVQGDHFWRGREDICGYLSYFKHSYFQRLKYRRINLVFNQLCRK